MSRGQGKKREEKRYKDMQRKAKTVTTKDGYVIKKHTMTLQKGRFYTIEKDSSNKGWYTYKELFNALSVLRLMEDKAIEYISSTLCNKENF